MDGNLSDMLQGVLSNPSAMEQIMGMAQSLMGDQGGNKASPPSPPPEEKEMPKEEKKGGCCSRFSAVGRAFGQ